MNDFVINFDQLIADYGNSLKEEEKDKERTVILQLLNSGYSKKDIYFMIWNLGDKRRLNENIGLLKYAPFLDEVKQKEKETELFLECVNCYSLIDMYYQLVKLIEYDRKYNGNYTYFKDNEERAQVNNLLEKVSAEYDKPNTNMFQPFLPFKEQLKHYFYNCYVIREITGARVFTNEKADFFN